MTLWLILWAAMAIAGWQLNKRGPSGLWTYLAAITVFIASIGFANAFVENQLIVRAVFTFTFLAFGFIMYGLKGASGAR